MIQFNGVKFGKSLYCPVIESKSMFSICAAESGKSTNIYKLVSCLNGCRQPGFKVILLVKFYGTACA